MASTSLRLPEVWLRRQIFAAMRPWFTALQLVTTCCMAVADTAEALSPKGVNDMIGSIGSSLGYYGLSQTQSSTTSLSQTEEKLFANIDSDGNGSISKSELTNFLDKVSGASGTTQPSDSAVSSLFTSMDSSGGGSISLSEFQSNASSLADQLRSQLAQAGSNSINSIAQQSGSSSASVAGSCGTDSSSSFGSSSAANSASSSSSDGSTGSSTSSTKGAHHPHHHGSRAGGGNQGGGSLVAQLLQQYQNTGSASSSTTVSTTA